MTEREDTILEGWKEFYVPDKSIFTLQRKLIITGAISFLFIVVLVSWSQFFLKATSTGPLKRELSTANLFKADFIHTPEITLKLKTSKKTQAILKARFSLEITSPDEKMRINQKMHLIANQLKKKLETYSAKDLKKVSGVETLRKDLLRKINKVMKPIKINRVFIKDFIIH